MEKEPKNIILYVGHVLDAAVKSIRAYEKKHKTPLRIAVLTESRNNGNTHLAGVDIILSCNLRSHESITKTLAPIQDQLLAITALGEGNAGTLRTVVPHVPYLATPTEKSLYWATNKLEMRRHLRAYDKNINPNFLVVYDARKKTLDEIEAHVGFPLVVKPTGLAESMLVSIVFHREEATQVLRRAFRKINVLYKKHGRQTKPTILVEQFMDGKMYSVDAYVTTRGKVHFCPMVFVKTGRAVGFDDFFGYIRLTPTQLSKDSVTEAEHAATQAIHALGLRNTSVHVELLQTEDGWKVIELGPRLGGFRHVMYEKSYGIDHAANDVLIRIPKNPVIPKKVLGHTAVMQFFAKEEGVLTSLKGTQKVKELKSFLSMKINRQIGERCLYAKNGGRSVINIGLFNKDRSKLLADIRRLEQTIKIETS